MRFISPLLFMVGVLVAGFALAQPLSPSADKSSDASDPMRERVDPVAEKDPPGGPAEILTRGKEAAGGTSWDRVRAIRTEAKLKTGGLVGPVQLLEDLQTGRHVNSYQLGPMSGQGGFDGRSSWSRDQAGSVRISEARAAQERVANEAYRVARAYWFPERWAAEVQLARTESSGDRRFHVLKIVPEGGRLFELWMDADTMLVDRTVEKGGIDTTTTFFSDYRVVSGIKLPHHLRSTNGEEAYDQFTEVLAVEVNPSLAADRFEVPEDRVGDFIIAGGKSSAVLPFELLNNHIYIRAAVDDQPVRILVDTGGVNLLTPSAAKELGIESAGALQGGGVGAESVDVGLAEVSKLVMGDVELGDQLFYIVPMTHLDEVEGVSFAGMVGYEVFKRFVVTIDYADRRLILHRPESFVYPGAGTEVPVVFEDHSPRAEGEIDGIPGTFGIDTGSRSSLTLLAPFVKKHGLIERYAPKVEALTGWGVGGGNRSHVTRADKLVLGKVEIPAPVLDLFTGDEGAFADEYLAGNVGGGVLKRFTVTFDYANSRMFLKKNRNFDQPDGYDRAGMWINQTGDRFEVKDVVEDGPAAQVGITIGDRILAVDGARVDDLSLSEVRERFRSSPAGTEVRLILDSQKGRSEVVLVLRDLI
jgi:hypothetical protein